MLKNQKKNPWKTPEEFIFKKLRAFNQQIYLKENYLIDIRKDFSYFLQTLHNDCFQTECMNYFLWISQTFIIVAKSSPDKTLVIWRLSKINLNKN